MKAPEPESALAATARLFVALVFWVLNVALHLEFSNWIVSAYSTPWGEFIPRDHTPAIATVLGLAFLAYLYRQWSRGSNRPQTVIAWSVVALAMILGMGLITTTAVEMIHYLQYGLLAWLLSRALDPGCGRWPLLTLMLLTTGLGVLDELNQYFFLTPNNSNYVDFNDFLLNQVGACAGLLARYGFATPPATGTSHWSRLQTITTGAFLICAFVVLGLGLTGHLQIEPEVPVPPGGVTLGDNGFIIHLQRQPGLYGSWQPTFTSGRYFVMGAPEWSIAFFMVSLLCWSWGLLLKAQAARHNR